MIKHWCHLATTSGWLLLVNLIGVYGTANALSTGKSSSALGLDSLKQSIIALESEMIMLEEDVQASNQGQVSVYLSIDAQVRPFLEEVHLHIGDTEVASARYDERQLSALANGGVQRLYLTNLPAGRHEIQLEMLGRWPAAANKANRRNRIFVDAGGRPVSLELQVIQAFDGRSPYVKVKQWEPSIVGDLRFGVARYAYLSQDYLSALSELQVARQRGGILGYGFQPLLLEGISYLAFGMEQAAEQTFLQLLNMMPPTRPRNAICLHRCRVNWQAVPEGTLNAARFYLGVLHYRQGDHHAAERYFDQVGEVLSPRLTQELNALRIQCVILDNRLQQAQQMVAAAAETLGPWRGYVLYHLGVALLEQGDAHLAHYYLDQVATLAPINTEQQMLSETALLAVGEILLQGSDYAAATSYFARIQDSSPQRPLALWGHGISEASAGNYKAALAPWLKLTSSPLIDLPVQAALIAIPHAYEQMGALAQASSALGVANRKLSAALTATNSVLADIATDGAPSALLKHRQLAQDNPWMAQSEILGSQQVASHLQQLVDQEQLVLSLRYWLAQLPRYRALIEQSATKRSHLAAHQTVFPARSSRSTKPPSPTRITTPIHAADSTNTATQLEKLRKHLPQQRYSGMDLWPWDDHQALIEVKRTMPRPTLKWTRLAPPVQSSQINQSKSIRNRLKPLEGQLQRYIAALAMREQKTRMTLDALITAGLQSNQRELRQDLAHTRLEQVRLSLSAGG